MKDGEARWGPHAGRIPSDYARRTPIKQAGEVIEHGASGANRSTIICPANTRRVGCCILQITHTEDLC